MIGTLYSKATGMPIAEYSARSVEGLSQQVKSDEHDMVMWKVQPDEYIIQGPLNPMVRKRQVLTPVIDRMTLVNDGVDTVTLTIPDPCILKVGDYDIIHSAGTTTYEYSTTVPGPVIIQFLGEHMGELIIMAHNIEDLRAIRKNEINKRYTAEWEGGFIYAGNEYQSDQVSMNMITAVAAEAGRNPPKADDGWMTKDNTWIPMNRAGFEGLASALYAHTSRLFRVKRAKKTELNLMTTLNQILNLDIENGW